jgi:GNAT superfamily N-acetyltransferase
VRTRRLGPGDDLEAAIDLLQRFFREEGFATPGEVIAANARRMAAMEACAIVVVEDGGAPAGIATVSMEFGIEYGWSAEMGDLYVLPEWRGKGLARTLVTAVEDILRARGATGYQVTVTAAADEAHGLRRFYAALGFEDECRAILSRKL